MKNFGIYQWKTRGEVRNSGAQVIIPSPRKPLHLINLANVINKAIFWIFIGMCATLPSKCVIFKKVHSTMADKCPLNTNVMPWIICVLQLSLRKHFYPFENALLLPPSPSNAMLNLKRNCLQQTCSTFWLWGEAGQVKLHSRATVCLRCEKFHKCKFVPRFLSIIVEWII